MTWPGYSDEWKRLYEVQKQIKVMHGADVTIYVLFNKESKMFEMNAPIDEIWWTYWQSTAEQMAAWKYLDYFINVEAMFYDDV